MNVATTRQPAPPPKVEPFRPITFSITCDTREEFLSVMALANMGNKVAADVAKYHNDMYPKVGVCADSLGRILWDVWQNCRNFAPTFFELNSTTKI